MGIWERPSLTAFGIMSQEFDSSAGCRLTHWGRMTHICVGKLTIIASDNGLSPGRRQAIIWTNAGISLIGPLRTNFSEILIEMYIFSFKKMHLKFSSQIWLPFCLGLNVLKGMKFWYGSIITVNFLWSIHDRNPLFTYEGRYGVSLISLCSVLCSASGITVL